MLSASREERKSVSTQLRNMLDDLSNEAAFVCDEDVGCLDEVLTTDQHLLEIVLLTQATEWMALLKAYRVERKRLEADYAELVSELEAHDRADKLGYGHLQRELV